MKKYLCAIVAAALAFAAHAQPFLGSGGTGGPPYAGSFTYTTLPTCDAAHLGVQAFASDWGAYGAQTRCNGTRWVPVNGQVVLKRMGAGVSGIANAETIATKVQFPIGALQTGDTILVRVSFNKSGTTDSLTSNIRVGTAGTTGDTPITGFGASTLVAASQSAGFVWGLRVLSNTSLQRMGNGNVANASYALGASGATAAATTGLSDFSANADWLSVTLQSSSTTNTVGVQEATIIQEVGN